MIQLKTLRPRNEINNKEKGEILGKTAKPKTVAASKTYMLTCYIKNDERFVAICNTKTEAVKLFRDQLRTLINMSKDEYPKFKVPTELRKKWVQDLHADFGELENVPFNCSFNYYSLVCFEPRNNTWYDTSDIDYVNK